MVTKFFYWRAELFIVIPPPIIGIYCDKSEGSVHLLNEQILMFTDFLDQGFGPATNHIIKPTIGKISTMSAQIILLRVDAPDLKILRMAHTAMIK